MGNNTISEINGVGKIRIKRPDGSIVVLTDVKFMPTMGRNLSYGCLEGRLQLCGRLFFNEVLQGSVDPKIYTKYLIVFERLN